MMTETTQAAISSSSCREGAMKKALFVLLGVLWTMHAYGEKRTLFLIWKEPGYKGWQSLISQLGGGTGGAGSEAGGSGGTKAPVPLY